MNFDKIIIIIIFYSIVGLSRANSNSTLHLAGFAYINLPGVDPIPVDLTRGCISYINDRTEKPYKCFDVEVKARTDRNAKVPGLGNDYTKLRDYSIENVCCINVAGKLACIDDFVKVRKYKMIIVKFV